MAETWLLCSACRTDIAFSSKYFQCSVSTCNRARMRLVFCSVVCWDSHVATLRHRDSWAEDKIAPTKAEWEREQGSLSPDPARPAAAPARPATPTPPVMTRPGVATATAPGDPARRVVGAPTASSSFSATPAAPAPAAAGVHLSDVADRDMLIVISKLKKYIKDRSGMNCSDAVADVLSDHIRVLCDDSIRAAGRDERKTVLDRDVPRPRLR
jgi:hypothetical protein